MARVVSLSSRGDPITPFLLPTGGAFVTAGVGYNELIELFAVDIDGIPGRATWDPVNA